MDGCDRAEESSAYAACLRRIWSAHGSPSAERIAGRTDGTFLPLSPSQVEEYLDGRALPETSLMLHILLRGIKGHDGAAPGDEDDPAIFTLWRRASGQPDPAPTTPLPPVPPAEHEPDFAPFPTTGMVELTVQVAAYLGAAGIGGIIGNRADSAVVRTTARLFQSVRDRWRHRGGRTGEPLSEEEAVDAAIAAAIALDYSLDLLRVTGADPRSDGSWRVTLAAPDATLRAVVPAGDPAEATILIMPG
ncbi:hypothetical protein [Actinoallomurus iriomotensis]|uniref:Uncharacterized protein n=1 Tax=Actinoallomurus iriomotensis TaxID=478107 RepID=A0A9W6RZ60_9ACTN|nr:hypothetical protein [Actinoallomurus iriomotensis]GLY84194.1 hypothetical protein Airi02_021230 [Actinoallomurus iriomotensis]